MTASLDFSQNHFELFGLTPGYTLDAERLDRAYRDIQGAVHPDRFAHAGEAEKRLSMQWTTRVNEAYQTLRKPFERARYLLQLNGVDALDARNTAMPADFLMQQMEWRESLEAARGQKNPAALQGLERDLRVQAGALQGELGELLDVRRDFPRASETLRKLRFMDKLLEEIEAAYEDIL